MMLRSLAAVLLGMCSLIASAADAEPSLVVTGAWSRAMPLSAPTGAVYFNLENKGSEPDRLIAAFSTQAEKTELHTHIKTDEGLMRMQAVEAVTVPANGHLAFKPGSYHVMLLGLTKPLVAGEHLSLSLTFEKQGELKLEVPILEQAPPTASHQSH